MLLSIAAHPFLSLRYISTAFQAPIGYHFLRMASTLPRLPIFEAIARHEPQSPAIVHCVSGRRFSYGGVLQDVANATVKLRHAAGQPLEGQRVAFLVENGYDYVGAHRVCSTSDQSLTKNSDLALNSCQ